VCGFNPWGPCTALGVHIVSQRQVETAISEQMDAEVERQAALTRLNEAKALLKVRGPGGLASWAAQPPFSRGRSPPWRTPRRPRQSLCASRMSSRPPRRVPRSSWPAHRHLRTALSCGRPHSLCPAVQKLAWEAEQNPIHLDALGRAQQSVAEHRETLRAAQRSHTAQAGEVASLLAAAKSLEKRREGGRQPCACAPPPPQFALSPCGGCCARLALAKPHFATTIHGRSSAPREEQGIFSRAARFPPCYRSRVGGRRRVFTGLARCGASLASNAAGYAAGQSPGADGQPVVASTHCTHGPPGPRPSSCAEGFGPASVKGDPRKQRFSRRGEPSTPFQTTLPCTRPVRARHTHCYCRIRSLALLPAAPRASAAALS
jgi:hypothetical protein